VEEQCSRSGSVDYMGQEEEWGREGLLDPAWEKQQKKTFTAWCNSHLRKLKTQIVNIEEDFRDGLKLMLLLEVISGETLPKPDRGRMRIHMLSNVNKALSFIESKGVKLVNIGATEIVDGNLTLTLGMIWTIILRFAIQDISVEEMTAKEGLLLWCKRKTAGYKNVNVQNFHMSFKDGLAFCALIHRHRPDLLDYSKLSRDNALENLNLAFDVAEKHLDIPRMLDAEDMVETVKPDERSVMAYVSSYYHAFSGAQQAETAAARICKVLKNNQEHEKLMNDYEHLASQLLDWIAKTRPWLEDRKPADSLDKNKANIKKYEDYRGNQKVDKLNEKAKLEAAFNTLQTMLRLSNKPAYLPSDGKLVSDIVNAWTGLENAEKGFEDWLLAELQRLERLDFLAKKFRQKCKQHDEWSVGKEDLLKSTELNKLRFDEVKAEQKKQEAVNSELTVHHQNVEEISALAHELCKLGYYDAKAIAAECKKVCDQWDKIQTLAQKKQTTLNDLEKAYDRIDQLYLDFAKRGALFHNWMKSAQDDLQDLFIVHNPAEVQGLLESHEIFKKSLVDAEKNLNGILAVDAEARQIQKQHNITGYPLNPYTNFSPQVLSAKWQVMKQMIPERDSRLQAELSRQQSNEQLRKQFALKANVIGQWIEKHLDGHAAMFSQKGTLDEQLTKLKAMLKEVIQYRPNFEELERFHHALNEGMVFDNPHTPYTMETLHIGWEQLLTSLNRSINEVENQILTRDSKGISAKQMEEYTKSFRHFDRSRNNRLEPTEFKACLISVGYNISDSKQGESDFQRIMATVDPNNLGYVSFEAFLDFISRETSDVETSEQLLQSFRILAGDKPYITADVLQRELPPEYFEYCLQRMQPYRGHDAPPGALDYNSFSMSLYGVSDL